MENGLLVFLSPPPALGASGQRIYDVHFKFTGKRVVDFLLVLIELFCYRCNVEALRANID